MAIYSSKYAKELIADSICLDESSSQAGVRIRAVLKGETRERVFHVNSLLADGGKKEINDLIAALTTDSKKPTAENRVRSGLDKKDDVA